MAYRFYERMGFRVVGASRVFGDRRTPGEYPRVIDSQGKAPRQYHYTEDDDEDEEWDEDE